MDPRGKTALVTGGTDGIGLEIARQLRTKAANVVVCGRRAELVEKAKSEGLGGFVADLSSVEGVLAALAEWGDRPIDILVNNAGVSPPFDANAAVDSDMIDRAVFLNLNAPIRLVVALLPRLKAQPTATIVNVTSGLAIAPRAGSPVYCATKAGLRSFTMALRAQLVKTNVHVIEALPPIVETAMTADRYGKGKMTPKECARQIVEAIVHDHDEANVGQVKLLRAVYSISPALARRVMLRF